VLPGGIQDKSSNHKPEEMHALGLSEFSYFTFQTLCQPPESQVTQLHSEIKGAEPERQTECRIGSWSTSELTKARRLQLAELMFKIYKHTAWMGEILLAAQTSDLIDPDFITRFVKVKDHLEVVALTIREYKQNNKEQGTPQLKRGASVYLAQARKQCTYLARILQLPLLC